MRTKLYYFLYGIRSLFDILGTHTFTEMENRSDEEALRSDWEKIGGDIQKAMYDYGEQIRTAH